MAGTSSAPPQVMVLSLRFGFFLLRSLLHHFRYHLPLFVLLCVVCLGEYLFASFGVILTICWALRAWVTSPKALHYLLSWPCVFALIILGRGHAYIRVLWAFTAMSWAWLDDSKSCFWPGMTILGILCFPKPLASPVVYALNQAWSLHVLHSVMQVCP
ncbi:hypothetical protein AMTR_s00044p00188030 [Amborella trichopoda]|uniref:Uncharacterized protein n=1 Tax=Amborella trichopoda TaxID=13333 RepID=U5D464_AMBTC|nr:hypothetical protein AMTR_s00044p00188030 [Amborella trichopoda]